MDVDLDFGLEAPAASASEAAPNDFTLLDTAMEEPTTSDEPTGVEPSAKADARTEPCRQQWQHHHQPRPLPRLTALAYPTLEQQQRVGAARPRHSCATSVSRQWITLPCICSLPAQSLVGISCHVLIKNLF